MPSSSASKAPSARDGSPRTWDWLAVDEAFERVLDLDPDGARRDSCLEDLPSAVRAEVEALLARVEPEGPLDRGVGNVAGQLLTVTAERLDRLAVGRRLGSYRLVDRLGAGGMGVVYLAERADGEFEHRVALKVLRWELADDLAIERFRTERRILARLSHPNIATLIDGGVTSEGLPYLALEWVDGRPIDRYCDEQGLDLRERLRLMESVCRGVDYAHRKLVVHRDLKPANVLVRDDGVAKLLDFGIAKMLEPAEVDDRTSTHTLLAPLTPRYAAPEQRSGGAASVATDVWALGVVLDDLLQGSRRRHPDLENIIDKTQRDDPEERYPNAGALADDLRSLREGRPVSASPPSLVDRTHKLARRHRAATLGLACAALAVLLGVFGVVWQAGEARRERDAARVEAARAEQVSSILTGLFESATPRIGEEPSVRELLDRGAQQVRAELREAPRARARLIGTLGTAYTRLGEYEQARELLEEAVEIESGLGTRSRTYVRALTDLGGVLQWSGHPEEAEPLFFRALDILREEELDSGGLEASIVHSLALTRADRGDAAGALPLYREAIALFELHDPEGLRMARANLGVALNQLGRAEEAEIEHRAALADYRRFEPRSATIATILSNLSLSVSAQGRDLEAIEILREAIELRGRHSVDDPGLPAARANLAAMLIDSGRPGDALPHAEAAVEALRGSPPGSKAWIGARANLGWALAQSGALAEGERWLHSVVADTETAFGESHVLTARARTLLGETYRRKGDARGARRQLGLAVQRLGHAESLPLHRAHALLAHGALLCDTGEPASGLGQVEQAELLLAELVRTESWKLAEARIERARCRRALGRPVDERARSAAAARLREVRGSEDWVTLRSAESSSS